MPVTLNSGTLADPSFFPKYRDLKNKYKLKHDDSMYSIYCQNAVSVMFEYDEKIYRSSFFDKILRDMGMAALIKTETADYTPVVFYPCGGERYADGWFKNCKCFDFIGNSYDFEDWESNPDILVFFNTPLRYPDTFVEKYAEMLSDVDMSINNNVHYSRQHPFPVAKDRQTKARIDSCIKSVSEGTIETVLMENSIKDVLGENDEIEIVNITDVEKSQYIQYLSHLHDSIISRFFFLIGLGTTDNGKQAQITTEELNKNDDASITQALAWYQARKEGFDDAREKGHDLSFDFHPVWKQRIERIINPPEVGANPEESDDNGDSEDPGSPDNGDVDGNE